jgi:superfamily II DNA or RNA helicase
VTVIINSVLRLIGFPEHLIDKYKALSTGKNPEYSVWERTVAVKPFLRYSKKYPQPPRTISLFSWDGEDLILPRGLLGDVVRDCPSAKFIDQRVTPKFDQPHNVNITLRDYQEQSVNAVLRNRGTIVPETCGFLQAATGSGKTVMGLKVIADLGYKALFVVHTKRLLQQTLAEIKEKMNYEAGIIGDGKFEIKDITVAMIQTMLRRDMTPYANSFGTVVIDEVHHVPAKAFIEVTKVFNAKHFYGLSATPERADGLTWALKQVVGPELHKVDKQKLQNAGAIIKPDVNRVDTPYIPSRTYDPFEVTKHIEDVSNNDKRNSFVVNFIKGKLRPSVLSVILTERVDHVEFLYRELEDLGPVMYHGKLSKSIQEAAATAMKEGCPLTIATYASISEGFDVPAWGQLFLVTPFSSATRATQALGRISRASKGKTKATVYDFVDLHDPLLLSRYEKRLKVYDNL